MGTVPSCRSHPKKKLSPAPGLCSRCHLPTSLLGSLPGSTPHPTLLRSLFWPHLQPVLPTPPPPQIAGIPSPSPSPAWAPTSLLPPCCTSHALPASLPYCWDPSPIISCAPHAACLPHCWDPSLACTPHTLPMKPPLICVGRKILKHGWCQGHSYLSQQLSDIVDHIRNKLPEPSLPAPRQGPQLWSTPPPVTHAQCPAGRGGI